MLQLILVAAGALSASCTTEAERVAIAHAGTLADAAAIYVQKFAACPTPKALCERDVLLEHSLCVDTDWIILCTSGLDGVVVMPRAMNSSVFRQTSSKESVRMVFKAQQ